MAAVVKSTRGAEFPVWHPWALNEVVVVHPGASACAF
jgi:hypothetical protein